MRPVSEDPDLMLEVGSEGGSLSIRRVRTPAGQWGFAAYRNESALADFMDEADASLLTSTSPIQDSFSSALKQIARYPWPHLYLIALHPDVAEMVFAEVRRLAGESVEQDWRIWFVKGR